MKHMKKIMALIIAAVMIMGTMGLSAFAAPGDLKSNSTLTVSGLGEKDTVEYYQILAWDQDKNTADGWVWGSGMNVSDTMAPLTSGALRPSDIYGTSDGQNLITFVKAGILGQNLKTGSALSGGSKSGDTWTANNVAPGLYMVVVTSGTPGTIYNPIFVAANWIDGNKTSVPGSSWIVTSDASYADAATAAVAKKTSIPLKKTAKGKDTTENAPYQTVEDGTPEGNYTTEIGEEIDFKVESTIPVFGTNYKNPVFKLSDTLKGLELTAENVVVTPTGGTIPSGRYSVVYNQDKDGYVITFDPDWLKTLQAPLDIEVTYTAKVTDKCEKLVNQENNTVELQFSANPSDETGKAKLKDETNHFSFSIDADLFGSREGHGSSTEAIKIGVDKDNNPIMSYQTYEVWDPAPTHAALSGATFQLKDKVGNVIATAESDATGRITFKGLDVGEYELVETKAPKGWIKAQKPIPVEIKADIVENVTVTDSYEVDGTKVTTEHKTNELKSYSIKVGGQTTSYTLTNSADKTMIDISRNPASSDSEIKNTKGVELPSTGGIGTTIFYIIGAILVVGAGVLLVTKRRMNVEG
jgi:fimbrial isopeptide formation D2 family protein/LPXTG-motif cell wall-anchored protein